MSFQDYFDRAGLEPDNYEVVEEGDIVNTAIIWQGDERSVFQYADTGGNVVSFTRGSKVYDFLEDKDVSAPEKYDDELRHDYAWHHVDFVEGEHPESDEDFFEVGKSLAEMAQELEDDSWNIGYVNEEPSSSIESFFSQFWEAFVTEKFEDRISYIGGTRYETPGVRELKKSWDRSQIHWDIDVTLLHGDVSPYNVKLSDNSVTWIDFDQALFGDPDYEFFTSEQRLNLEGIDPEPFCEGYRSVRDFEEEEHHDNYKAAAVVKHLYALKTLERDDVYSASNEQIQRLAQELEDIELENRKIV